MEHYILAQNRNFLQNKYKSQAPFLNIFVLIKPAYSINIYTLFLVMQVESANIFNSIISI